MISKKGRVRDFLPAAITANAHYNSEQTGRRRILHHRGNGQVSPRPHFGGATVQVWPDFKAFRNSLPGHGNQIPDVHVHDHLLSLGWGSSGGGLPQSRDHRNAQTQFYGQDYEDSHKTYGGADFHDLAGAVIRFHGTTLPLRLKEVLIERITVIISWRDEGVGSVSDPFRALHSMSILRTQEKTPDWDQSTLATL